MEQQETSVRLVRIETKLDILIAQEADKEARIRSLERRDGYVLGMAAALSLLAPLALKKLFGI